MTYTNDPILPAWYIPGWSTQLASYPENVPGDNQFNPFPDTLISRKIVGDFFTTDENPRGGYLLFTPTTKYLRTIGEDAVTISATSQKVYLRRGHLYVELLATDNVNVTPASFTYEVKESWLNGNTYHITVPIVGDEDDEINILDLIVPEDDGTNSLTFLAGDSLVYTIQYLYDDGEPIPGFDGTLTLRDGTTVLESLSATWNAGTGTYTVTISPSMTTSLAADGVDNYVFKVQNVGPTEVHTLESGPVTVQTPYGG